MDEAMKVVYEGGTGEITEKKSRFIANICSVETESAALQFIEKMKKKYWDAKHNCFAFVIGEHMEIQRFSDDGEPQGTAGKPILEVLLGEQIHNTAIVVTRYFGGTLLGTGGLVRAYGRSAKAGLEQSVVVEKKRGLVLEIQTDYNGLGKVQYLLGQEGVPILDCEYTEAVTVKALVPFSALSKIREAVTQVTGGKSTIEEKEELYFAEHGKELLVF